MATLSARIRDARITIICGTSAQVMALMPPIVVNKITMQPMMRVVHTNGRCRMALSTMPGAARAIPALNPRSIKKIIDTSARVFASKRCSKYS